MKNKKILIPIIILIAVVVLFATFVIFGGKDKPILIADDNDVNVEETQEELEEELEDQLEVAKLALTLLEDGKVNLYSIDTDEMISQLDLALTHSETIKENTESVGMLVTDKESLVGQSEVFITSEESDPVSEEVETTSKDIYKNIKNGSDEFLIFYNENSDRLFSIKTTNGVITRELLLNGIDVKNLNTVWADNDVIYLTMKDKKRIESDLKDVIKLLTETEIIEKEITGLNVELLTVTELINKLIQENSKSNSGVDEYDKKLKKLKDRYNDLKQQRDELTNAKSENQAKSYRIKMFLDNIENSDNKLKDWNDNIWMLMVESGKVYRNKSIRFKFHNGLKTNI